MNKMQRLNFIICALGLSAIVLPHFSYARMWRIGAASETSENKDQEEPITDRFVDEVVDDGSYLARRLRTFRRATEDHQANDREEDDDVDVVDMLAQGDVVPESVLDCYDQDMVGRMRLPEATMATESESWYFDAFYFWERTS